MRKQYDMGRDSFNAGGTTTLEGLAGLRDLAGQYEGAMNDPLGANVRRGFEVLRGRIADDATRQRSASVARIGQLAVQRGGSMSPEAQAELTAQTDRAIAEEQFNSEAQMGFQRAQLELLETNKLRDRLESIRRTYIGVGQSERDRGASMMTSGNQLRYQRMKAIDESIRSWAGMAGGSGTAGWGQPSQSVWG